MASKYERAFSWNEQAVESLRHLWCDEGMSASQIANILAVQFSGSISRNSVIGKVNRLGFTKKVVRRAGAPKPKKAISVVKQSLTTQPAPKNPTTFEQSSQVAAQIIVAPIPPATAPGLSSLLSIAELRETTCRFPIGDPREEGFGFCGADSPIGGSPYCDFHHRLAYVPLQKSAPRKSTDPRGMRRIQMTAF